MTRTPMDLAEAETLARGGYGRVSTALLAELDRLRDRVRVAEERAEMAVHDARWGTR